MLGWLAAAAIPLLIHFWNRRKHREASWAAVEFLLAAIRKNARRMQFEQWLLLAVRTLIILLVTLALAEPYARQLGILVASYRPTHKLFVLDGSYSMAYRQADESLFERAKHTIADIVDAGNPGDAYSLILIGEPSRAIVQSPARSANDFIDELDNLQQPHAGGDVVGALVLAEDALRRAEQVSTPLKQHEVYILSDLGQTSWQSNEQGKGLTELLERLGQLAQRAAVLVLDLGHENSHNSAVTSLTIDEPFLTLRRPTTFTAVIRNFGSQSRPQTLVEFEVDGQSIENRRVNLPADGSVSVAFTHTFDEPGPHTATARLAGDFLAIDDGRHVAFHVIDHVQVLMVEGKHGASLYLAHALNPNRSEDGTVRTRIVSEIALAETQLRDYDCVFLANVAQFTRSERRILERYLEQGGGLVIFLGDQVMPAVYNEVLGPRPTDDDADGLLPFVIPARIGELMSGAVVKFDALDYRHPIVAPFRGRENAGLLSTPVYRFYRLQIPEDRPEVQAALAIANGDPAIVTSPAGQGRCVLVATAGSLASVDSTTGQPWTPWPVWPSFLPIVREVLNYAVAGRQEQYNAHVNQPIGTVVEVGATSLMEVHRPFGGLDTVRVEDAGDGLAWSYPLTDVSGTYNIHPPGEPDRNVLFAVNVDTAESDLKRIDPSLLPGQIPVRSTWKNLQPQDVGDLIGEQRLHRWLLMGALGLLVLELMLAQYFGRGTS